jgi:hypothetical protein
MHANRVHSRAAPEVFAVKKKSSGDSKVATGPKMFVSADVKRCRLLELPPAKFGYTLFDRHMTDLECVELRNRIYYMAKEADFDADWCEPPLLDCKEAPTELLVDVLKEGASEPPPLVGKEGLDELPLRSSGREYLGLPQTCKQIRSEYRPLWLRKSAIRIEFSNLTKFIATFHPAIEDYSIAPKLLLISWDHDEDDYDDTLLDITNLLRVCAFCPTFSAHFKSRRLIECDLPDVECEHCGHSIICSCDSGCSQEESFDDAMGDVYEEYWYTQLLDEILANDRPHWLKLLRVKHDAITVECTIDFKAQRLTVYIRFREGKAPACLTKKAMFTGAMHFLKYGGFLDLPSRKCMDFVVGEATSRYTRHLGGCRTLVPTFNQIEIPGDTVYKPKKKAESAGDA